MDAKVRRSQWDDVGVVGLVPDRWGPQWRLRHHVLSRLADYIYIVWMNYPHGWRECRSKPRRQRVVSSEYSARPAGLQSLLIRSVEAFRDVISTISQVDSHAALEYRSRFGSRRARTPLPGVLDRAELLSADQLEIRTFTGEAAMNHTRPRVSIGVPVRNGARFLGQTLDSLLAQTYKDFELIISDNASTDETETICQSFAARDRRVRYHRSSQNLGAAHNINYLFQQARGEYFKLAAADDLHQPDYVARCLDVLEHDSAVVLAYARTRFIDENGAPLAYSDPGFNLQSDSAEERLRYCIFAGHWVNAIFGVIRAKALAKTQLLPKYAGGDYHFLGELALAGKFVEIPETLFLRRLHPGASSQNTHNPRWQVQHWTGTGETSLPVWNRCVDDLKTIVSSELNPVQKLSLTGSLVHSMLSRRGPLLAELRTACFFGLRSKSSAATR
jgi:Glycosyl transferase family 2